MTRHLSQVEVAPDSSLADPAASPPGRSPTTFSRLRIHGLITRVAGIHRHRVTDSGLEHALFLTRAHDRLLRIGLVGLANSEPSKPTPRRAASRRYRTALNTLTRHAGLAT